MRNNITYRNLKNKNKKMAAIGKIRSWGPVLIGVVGLALFAFIAGDLWQSCEATGNEKRMQVGEVLGKKISVQDYQVLVDEYQEVYKLTREKDNLTEDETNAVQDQVWQSLVVNTIMADEAEKLGLTVTDEEMQNVLKEGTNPMLMNPYFVNPQTGRFDVSALKQFLDAYKNGAAAQNPQLETLYKYWTFTEKNLREQILAMKYQNLLFGSFMSNPISAQMAFDAENTESNIQLASVAYTSIKDDEIEVTDAELKAKYEELKEAYKTLAETRDIKYVDFKVVPSEEDRNTLMQAMTEAADKLKAGEAEANVVRKAQSQILFTGIPVTNKAFPNDIAACVDTLEVGETTAPFETKLDNTFNVVKLVSKTSLPDSIEYRMIQVVNNTTTADSIYTALQGGADFEEIAKKYGQTGAKQWMTTAMYENAQTIDADTKSYIETLNTLGVNEIKNLAMTQANLIIQVTNRAAMTDKYVVAAVKHTIDISNDTYSAAYNKFSQFVSENQSLDSMEVNAPKAGYVVRDRKNVQNTEHYVAGIRATGNALKWIFEAEKGDVSQLYECGNNDHLLVVVMTGVNPVGYASLESVKEEIKAAVLADKKFAKISELLAGVKNIDEAKGKGANVADVNQITFAAPVYVTSLGTSEPALSGAVSATKEGEFSGNLIKGNGGAYLFQVVKTQKREGVSYDEKKMVEQLEQQAAMGARNFMSELYMNSETVDKRYLFF